MAVRLGRSYVGCEINPEYIKLSKARLIGVNDRDVASANGLVFCPTCEEAGDVKMFAPSVIERAREQGRKITCSKCMKRYTYEELGGDGG